MLIPPEVRARLRTLHLSARRAGGSSGVGVHPSHSRGAGIEFAQYRAYTPGDEPRAIDWKLYARSDRIFVRDATRDSPLAVWLLLDASASMAQADAALPQRPRLQAARQLAACFAELALQQGDAFGLLVPGRAQRTLALGSGTRHRDRLHLALENLRAEGAQPPAQALRTLWPVIAPGALVVVLSDGFDDALVAFAENLAATRREVLFVQILCAEERDFPFAETHEFRDVEGGGRRTVTAPQVREDFLQRFAAARATLHLRLRAAGIRSVGYVLDQPLQVPLHQLLGRRGVAA